MTRALSLIAACLLAACSKTDPEPSGAAPSVASATAPPSAKMDAEPPKTAASAAAPSASATASGTPAASGSAAPLACGTRPLPDCPLQAWMKAHANPPVMTSNLPALATALDEMVAFAPPGYTNWASISKDGASAARAGDLAAAKASCRSCHDQYKEKYKTELRGRKI